MHKYTECRWKKWSICCFSFPFVNSRNWRSFEALKKSIKINMFLHWNKCLFVFLRSYCLQFPYWFRLFAFFVVCQCIDFVLTFDTIQMKMCSLSRLSKLHGNQTNDRFNWVDVWTCLHKIKSQWDYSTWKMYSRSWYIIEMMMRWEQRRAKQKKSQIYIYLWH